MAIGKFEDRRVSAENLTGKKVPRRAGLVDETAGKGVGTRNIRSINGRFFRYAGDGRR